MKEVILIGRGPSWVDCPFDAETWGVLSCYSVPVLKEKHFDKMFAFDPLVKKEVEEDGSVSEKTDPEIELGLQTAKEQGVPVVSVHPYATEPYPLQEVLDKVYRPGYLQNSICHMIAMAILQGYEKIRLYGIDQYRGIYLLQKGAVEFWCGLAIGRGIKVEIAPSSMLLTEYLREVASVAGNGDDAPMTSLQEVMPFKIKRPIIAYPIRLPDDELIIRKPVAVKTGASQYAFYDLEVAPATYDIVQFLVLAEKRRIALGCDDLRVVIVPGANRFRKGDLQSYQAGGNYDSSYMEWRLRNILVPCCWLMPSCSGVMVCGDREEAQKIIDSQDGYLYPEGYKVANPVGSFLLGHIQAEEGELPSLQATPQAKRYVSQWLKENTDGGKVVTINLRETTYEPDRNSNLIEWKRFYWKLKEAGYEPLLIPDMERASSADGFKSYPEVLWNIELRLALYELSYLNLFVNTGPAALALLDKSVSCLVFKWLTPTSGATTKQFYQGNGLAIGDQLKWTTERQRIIWEDDKIDIIEREFKQFEKEVSQKYEHAYPVYCLH